MAFGHVEPLPVEYPPRRAEIAEPLSTAWHPKAVKTLAFTMPVNKTIMSMSNPIEQLIWAYGKVRPEKPWHSMLTQHYMAGRLTMNLGRTLPLTPPTGITSASIPSPGGKSKLVRDRLIVVHGLFGTIGFLALLPSGVLFARWGRTLTSKWISMHKTVMFVAFPVISLGWILGPVIVSDRDPDAPHFSTAHQVRSGMEEWKMSSGDTHIAHWCHVLWNAWALVSSNYYLSMVANHRSWQMFILAYLIGLLLLQRQFFQERNGVVPGGGKYFALSSGAGAHHIFQISDESDDVLDKSLSSRGAAELVRKEPGSVPLLSDPRT
ncbi:hypothetical protein H0H92_007082 [Tricholoma furcatifolium]|nr:hypothetical protein H0H92_007082 [Tricholoma furcatifolium]